MIISVNSFDEAKNYPVLYNNSEIMLDNNRDVFYVKSVDSLGKYTMATYEFKRIENERPISADNFVTKEQFDGLNEQVTSVNTKLDTLLKELGGTKK